MASRRQSRTASYKVPFHELLTSVEMFSSVWWVGSNISRIDMMHTILKERRNEVRECRNFTALGYLC